MSDGLVCQMDSLVITLLVFVAVGAIASPVLVNWYRRKQKAKKKALLDQWNDWSMNHPGETESSPGQELGTIHTVHPSLQSIASHYEPPVFNEITDDDHDDHRSLESPGDQNKENPGKDHSLIHPFSIWNRRYNFQPTPRRIFDVPSASGLYEATDDSHHHHGNHRDSSAKAKSPQNLDVKESEESDTPSVLSEVSNNENSSLASCITERTGISGVTGTNASSAEVMSVTSVVSDNTEMVLEPESSKPLDHGPHGPSGSCDESYEDCVHCRREQSLALLAGQRDLSHSISEASQEVQQQLQTQKQPEA